MSGFDQARFREVLGHFATGITIVTATDEGEPVGFSCQSFAALSLDPPMVILAPAKSSTSWPRIARAGSFCVNILGEHQEAVCRAFAVSGGDKFDATVECTLGAIYEGGDHELVTGHVVDMEIGKGSPLIFYRSGFGRFEA